MTLQRLFASLLLWLAVAVVPTVVHALEVKVFLVNADGTTQLLAELTGAATVNLDSNTGGPRNYGPFTISRCTSGCNGRPRVFVSDGDVDRLVLTDAQIFNTLTSTATLRFLVTSDELSVSGPAGIYPYIAEVSGRMSGTSPTVGNQIRMRAFACHPSEGLSCSLIDRPENDQLETVPYDLSIAVPPYSSSVGGFGQTDDQLHFCGGFFVDSEDGESFTEFCKPTLQLEIDITLKGRSTAILPGSIGTHHVGDRCEPDANPPLLAGCERLAEEVAKLRPKGAKFYSVRLEPSPGAPHSLDFRNWASNSSDPWRTRRDSHDDDDDDGGSRQGVGVQASDTIARIDTSGVGEVRAKGLCPVAGCLPAGTSLVVRVFCGQEVTFTGLLTLNGKGDGQLDIATIRPCSDPGVLIMDQNDNDWAAAPAVLQ